MGASTAARLGLLLLRNERARNYLLAAVIGTLLGVGMMLLILISSVGAVFTMCKQTATSLMQPSSSSSPNYTSSEPSGAAISDIPKNFLNEYRKVGEDTGVDWAILAAVGKQETDHNRLEGSSDANGCITSVDNAKGPMQFIPSTWASEGVDGDGDGDKDPCTLEDAVPATAGYLKDLGAPGDYRGAVCSYYGMCADADADYANDVMAQAEAYRKAAGDSGEDSGGDSGGGSDDDSGVPAIIPPLISPAYAQEGDSGESGEATVGSPQGPEFSATELATVDLINEFRESNGLEPLKISEQISVPSARYAHDMAKYDAYREPEPHITGPSDYYPEGANLTVRMNNEGYYAGNYGENIAAGQASAQEVFDSWENSPGHREMMLNPNMTAIGIGLVENPETEYEEFWVTNFGDKTDSTAKTVEQAREGGGGGSGDSGGVSGGDPGKAAFPVSKEYMGEYSDDWGADRGDRTHEGTDIMVPGGEEIRSIVAGTVRKTEGSNDNDYSETGGYNIMVEATESVGPIKAGDKLYYAHMQEPPEVEEGDKVDPGDVIGNVGSTGYGPEKTTDNMPTHLHLGWYDSAGDREESPTGAMNPYPLLQWLKKNGGEAGGLGTPETSLASTPSGDGMPAFCTPFRIAGLIQDVGRGISDLAGRGGPGNGEVKGSASGKEVLEEARTYDGTAYELFACEPGSRMDCSCLTKEVFAKFGVQIPWAVMEQQNYGKPVEGEPEAGDLIVYGPGGGTPGHVGIANGKGGMFHCASPQLGCLESSDYKTAGPTPVLDVRRLVDGGDGDKGDEAAKAAEDAVGDGSNSGSKDDGGGE